MVSGSALRIQSMAAWISWSEIEVQWQMIMQKTPGNVWHRGSIESMQYLTKIIGIQGLNLIVSIG
jgi:DUF2075 family protein